MKRTTLLLLLICVAACLSAIPASEFLIGAYSQYQMRYVGTNHELKYDALGEFLHNAGFNATTNHVVRDTDFDYTKLGKALEKLEAHEVKTILQDLSWQNDNGEIGLQSLSFGNRLQMEAEYMLKMDIDGNFIVDDLETGASDPASEEYNYVFRHQTGDRYAYDPDNNIRYSNNFAWVCDESLGHLPNIALSQPRNRWKKWDESWPQLLSEDIQFCNSRDFLQNYTGSPVNENKLYLTVAMRFSGVYETDSVANISLKFYQPLNDDVYDPYGDMPFLSSYVELPLISTDNISYGTTIFGEEYPVNLKDSYGNYKFEFYVDLPDYADPESTTALYSKLMRRGFLSHQS